MSCCCTCKWQHGPCFLRWLLTQHCTFTTTRTALNVTLCWCSVVWQATGRKKIVIAGIVTDVCVAFPSLSALAEGFEVSEFDGVHA